MVDKLSNERIEKLISDMMRPVFVSNFARAKLHPLLQITPSQKKSAQTSYDKAINEIRALLAEWRDE